MRHVTVLILAILAVLVPSAFAGQCSGGTCGGNGAGAEVAGYSTGTWDIWRVNVPIAATLTSSITWVSSPGGADYDMTLWVPGADLDGRLLASEIIATSWTRSMSPGESISRSLAANPPGIRYVITVEPVMAKLETYTITASGGTLIGTCHPTASQATLGALCLPGATGSTKFRP